MKTSSPMSTDSWATTMLPRPMEHPARSEHDQAEQILARQHARGQTDPSTRSGPDGRLPNTSPAGRRSPTARRNGRTGTGPDGRRSAHRDVAATAIRRDWPEPSSDATTANACPPPVPDPHSPRPSDQGHRGVGGRTAGRHRPGPSDPRPRRVTSPLGAVPPPSQSLMTAAAGARVAD